MLHGVNWAHHSMVMCRLNAQWKLPQQNTNRNIKKLWGNPFPSVEKSIQHCLTAGSSRCEEVKPTGSHGHFHHCFHETLLLESGFYPISCHNSVRFMLSPQPYQTTKALTVPTGTDPLSLWVLVNQSCLERNEVQLLNQRNLFFCLYLCSKAVHCDFKGLLFTKVRRLLLIGKGHHRIPQLVPIAPFPPELHKTLQTVKTSQYVADHTVLEHSFIHSSLKLYVNQQGLCYNTIMPSMPM